MTDPRDRLIVGLDTQDCDSARRIVEQIGDAARFYKIGLGLFYIGGIELARELIAERLQAVPRRQGLRHRPDGGERRARGGDARRRPADGPRRQAHHGSGPPGPGRLRNPPARHHRADQHGRNRHSRTRLARHRRATGADARQPCESGRHGRRGGVRTGGRSASRGARAGYADRHSRHPPARFRRRRPEARLHPPPSPPSPPAPTTWSSPAKSSAPPTPAPPPCASRTRLRGHRAGWETPLPVEVQPSRERALTQPSPGGRRLFPLRPPPNPPPSLAREGRGGRPVLRPEASGPTSILQAAER